MLMIALQMAAFWRWDLVVLAGVVVSLASAQTPPILDDATGPRQIGECVFYMVAATFCCFVFYQNRAGRVSA